MGVLLKFVWGFAPGNFLKDANGPAGLRKCTAIDLRYCKVQRFIEPQTLCEQNTWNSAELLGQRRAPGTAPTTWICGTGNGFLHRTALLQLESTSKRWQLHTFQTIRYKNSRHRFDTDRLKRYRPRIHLIMQRYYLPFTALPWPA